MTLSREDGRTDFVSVQTCFGEASSNPEKPSSINVRTQVVEWVLFWNGYSSLDAC